jgi:uncharacterized membrane protein (Fun14 family)
MPSVTDVPRPRAPLRVTPGFGILPRIGHGDLRGLSAGVAFLAVVELLVGGFLLPAVRLPYEGQSVVFWTSVTASFARNLAAILGVVVATLYVSATVREGGLARSSRRITLAILAVLALPIQALALLVQVTPEMVFLSYTATYFLCLMTVMTAIVWPGPFGPRIGAPLVLLPVTIAFFATVVSRLAQDSHLPLGMLFMRTLDVGGEALVVGVTLVLPALFVRPEARNLRHPPGLVAGLLALLPTSAYVGVQIFGGDRVAELTQTTMGLELLLWPPLYLAGLFAFATTVLVNLLPATADRRGIPEIGIGLVLVGAAGQDAHTTYRLVLLLLGFQVLSAGVLASRTR